MLCRKLRDSRTRNLIGANCYFVTFWWSGGLGPNNIIIITVIKYHMYFFRFCLIGRHKIEEFHSYDASFLQK